MTAPRTSYPLPAQHPFGGMDAWRLLSLRTAASPETPFLTWHPFQGVEGVEGNGRTWTYGAFARDALAVAALRTFLTSGDPLEQAERNWLAEAAADPSGDAP